MTKLTYTEARTALAGLLRQMRLDAGLRQHDLAERLSQPQSFVSKYESGERRLDLVELHEICAAMGVPLAVLVARFGEAVGEKT